LLFCCVLWAVGRFQIHFRYFHYSYRQCDLSLCGVTTPTYRARFTRVTVNSASYPQRDEILLVASNLIELCQSDAEPRSRCEVLRRIGIARSCMNLLEKRIWKSSIRLDTKIRLYQTYIVPVLLYGCETWSTTKLQYSRIDAFDMWALRKILRIPYTRYVTNVEVRATTVSGCHPLSHLVTDRRLRLFGHIARS